MATKMTTSPLGLKLKELRQARGLSQVDLADRCGGRRTLIKFLESGRLRFVRHTHVEMLAHALEIPAEELWASIPGGPSQASYIPVDLSTWELMEEKRQLVRSSRVPLRPCTGTPPLPLGELQMDILGTLWDLGCASIRQIADRIRDGRSTSEASVSTVLQRLISRGLVRREKRAVYIYYPTMTRHEVVAAAGK
jgi:transcriptional regulator with XRE-family HTH domain